LISIYDPNVNLDHNANPDFDLQLDPYVNPHSFYRA